MKSVAACTVAILLVVLGACGGSSPAPSPADGSAGAGGAGAANTGGGGGAAGADGGGLDRGTGGAGAPGGTGGADGGADLRLDAPAQGDLAADASDGGDAGGLRCGSGNLSCAGGQVCVLHNRGAQQASAECVPDPCVPQPLSCICAAGRCSGEEMCMTLIAGTVTCQEGK
jgi:hypothetical protein